MRSWLAILSFCVSSVFSAGLGAENQELLATFDTETEAIQLEFENQASPGCFWTPYKVRDDLAAELEILGFRTRQSSVFVINIATWGVETDDYHCAVVLECTFSKYGVRVQVSDDHTVSTDLVIWDVTELLTGPKIHMDDRVREAAARHLQQLRRAIETARR